MAPKTSFTVSLRVEGLRETLRAFNKLPKDVNAALRDETLKLSQLLATRAQAAARGDSRQSALMAPTIKARRDRVPFIEAGGTSRVGRNRVPAYKVLFGAEFGSNRLPQFRPHRGQRGYFFFPVVERSEREIARAWEAVADEVIDRFIAGDIRGGR